MIDRDVESVQLEPEPTIWTLADRLRSLYHVIEEAGPTREIRRATPPGIGCSHRSPSRAA